jgi:hypothetical protein
MRYSCWLMAFGRPGSVVGFGTIAERSRRIGRTQSAIQPARMRSDARRLGDRCRERFTIRSWCLRRSDSAISERPEQAGQDSDEVDEKNDQIAHRRIVAGREIPRT